jgi:hypothetical protein
MNFLGTPRSLTIAVVLTAAASAHAAWGASTRSTEWSSFMSSPASTLALASVTFSGAPQARCQQASKSPHLPASLGTGLLSSPRVIGVAGEETVAHTLEGSERWTPPSPDLTQDARRRLADAAQNLALAPWQREFMMGMARDGYEGAAGDGRPEPIRTALPEDPTITDGNWAHDPSPSAREGPTAIFDPVGDRMVVFGGNNGSYFNDVWALSLAGGPAWTQLSPAGTPPSARVGHTAIYDPVRDRVVVFGGLSEGFSLNDDVWALSLAGSLVWTQLTPAGTPPSARYSHTSIYDPVRDRMVVFGGNNGSYSNDVWALSLAGSSAWTQLSPAGTPPSARYLHSAIYDPVHDRMEVFGGTNGSYFNDVWALSLAGSSSWTQLSPAGTPPSARYGHTAIYDQVGNRMVVFGGYSAGFLNDVWALSLADSLAWTHLTPAGTLPGAREAHTTIYDPVRDRMVVFGGYDVSLFKDVWALSLAGDQTWTPLTSPDPPPIARFFHTMIYDPVRDRMVVFGGNTGNRFLNDLWAPSLAGSFAWTQLTPSGTPPSAREAHTAIYDPVRDRMVVFGGADGASFFNDVSALSLAGGPSWTKLTPTGTPPSARLYHTAIYDPVRDRMVVFGGYSADFLNDVWALSLADSLVWTQLTPAGTPPSARYSHTAIYDPVRDRMVVFGGHDGSSPLNDVWALSLAASPAWSQLAPAATPPSARYSHTAIYDSVRDRMVVFGGADSSISGSLSDVWELSLAGSPAWTQLAPTGTPPSARWKHTAIYDPARDRMVVFAGQDGSGPLNDVWRLTWASTVSVPPERVGNALWLSQAHPNPSRSDITIGFTLSRASEATLRVYDVSGRVVRTLIEGSLSAGTKSVRWDRRLSSGGLAAPGLYFCELRVDGHRLARRIVLIQ